MFVYPGEKKSGAKGRSRTRVGGAGGNGIKGGDVVFLLWRRDVREGAEAELVGVYSTKDKADRAKFRAYEDDSGGEGDLFITYDVERREVK